MAAIVVDSSVTAANWNKAKPKDYKSADLDKAISAWETLAKKSVNAAVKPATNSIKGYEEAIKNAEGIAKHLTECNAQIDKVIAAAKKTAAELNKLGDKLKGDEKKKYQDAASAASAINVGAGNVKKTIA
jgi:hypothetical protein